MASTDWKEVASDGEAARFERFAVELGEMAKARAARTPATPATGKEGAGAMTPSRALHAKGQAGLEAVVEIQGGLPAELRHGLFRTPRRYAALVRVSNGSPRRQPDGRPDVRGLAVKVLGVDGKKLIPGLEDARTQDWLMIRTPLLPLANADEFAAVVRAAAGSPLLLLPRLMVALGPGRALAIVRKVVRNQALGFPPVGASSYFTAAPLQLGPHAARLSIAPVEPGKAAARKLGPEQLGDELAETLRARPLAWRLRVQLFVDEERTPIEAHDRGWDERDAPWQEVGTLTLPRQDVASPRGQAVSALVEELSFDPWHALAEHRPLGNVMRARNAAYRVSTTQRHARPEPTEDAIPVVTPSTVA